MQHTSTQKDRYGREFVVTTGVPEKHAAVSEVDLSPAVPTTCADIIPGMSVVFVDDCDDCDAFDYFPA